MCFQLFFEHKVFFCGVTLQIPISFKFAQRRICTPWVACLSSPSSWVGQTEFSHLSQQSCQRRGLVSREHVPSALTHAHVFSLHARLLIHSNQTKSRLHSCQTKQKLRNRHRWRSPLLCYSSPSMNHYIVREIPLVCNPLYIPWRYKSIQSEWIPITRGLTSRTWLVAWSLRLSVSPGPPSLPSNSSVQERSTSPTVHGSHTALSSV